LIQVVYATGQTVYVFIWNASGQIWNNNTSAFETFNPANWSGYAIAATEQVGTGNYFASVPTGIASLAGTYTWAAYRQLGGSPVSGDAPVGQGNLTISSPSSSGLAALLQSLRMLADDMPDSRTAWQETMGAADQPAFPLNGVNTLFKLKKTPMADAGGVPLYTWYSIISNGVATTTRSQVGITVLDPTNGIIQISPAPSPQGTPPNGLYVDYNWVWFTDAKYTEFLNRAANMTLAGTTDPTTIQEGLIEPMLQYALGQFWYARASKYAEQYASSGGEARTDVQTVCQAYQALGKAAYARGDYLKADFYKRQGQREAPAYGDVNIVWDPITPIR